MEQLTPEEIRSTADNWRRALEEITAPDTWQAEMITAIEAAEWPEMDTWPPVTNW